MMNDAQDRAAQSLEQALIKVAAAELKLYVYEGSVFVVPNEVDPQSHPNAIVACEELGASIYAPGLYADGGAGV